MSKTLRRILYNDDFKTINKKCKNSEYKIYVPQNKMSKRYSHYTMWIASCYAAGGYCRGHKTRSYDNQRLMHTVRQREKRLVQKEILNELTE